MKLLALVIKLVTPVISSYKGFRSEVNFYRILLINPCDIKSWNLFKNPELISEKVDENNNENDNLNEKQKFNIWDRVRIYKWKNKFEKGVTHSWRKEIFIIKKIYNKKWQRTN